MTSPLPPAAADVTVDGTGLLCVTLSLGCAPAWPTQTRLARPRHHHRPG